MPFIRTNLPIDTSPEKQRSIVQGIHDALVESIVSVQLSHIEVSPFWPDDGVHLTLVDTYASQISYSSHALS